MVFRPQVSNLNLLVILHQFFRPNLKRLNAYSMSLLKKVIKINDINKCNIKRCTNKLFSHQ